MFVSRQFCKVLPRLLSKRVIQIQPPRYLSLSRCQGEKWKLASAVCLERLPVVTREANDLQTSYREFMDQFQLETSVLSDHEVRHRDDLLRAQKRKEDDYEETEEEVLLHTAVEDEDAWEAELQAFQPAAKMASDEQCDAKSILQNLDQKMVLVVKQKLGDTSPWVFPQTPWKEGESMRQTAERALGTLCGTNLQAVFMGNAPCGFYKYKFPVSSQMDGCVGMKVFFFKAQLQTNKENKVTADDTNVEDYAWLSLDELSKYATPKYLNSVERFIISE